MYKFKIDDPYGKNLGSLEMCFPKTIFRSDNILSQDYLNQIKNFTNNLIDRNSLRTTALSVDSTHKTNNLIHYKEYDLLIIEILNRVRAFGEAMGFCSKTQMQNLYIANMWANRSVEGDFNFPHVHTNSIFSGVYYLESPVNSIITFYDNVYNMAVDPKDLNVFSYRHTQYPCITNSMFLFKSDLLHGNERQPTGNKLAISFNVMF
jgi:hypothetical protein